MSYIKQTWVDRAVEFFRRFSVTEDSAGNLTLTEEPGIVTSAGTPLDATRLNHIENGIEEVSNNLNLVQEALTPVDYLEQITLNSGFSFGVNSYLIKMDRFVYFALQIEKTSNFAVAEGVGVLPLEIRPFKLVGGSGTAGSVTQVTRNIQWTINTIGGITVLSEGSGNVVYISGVYFLG